MRVIAGSARGLHLADFPGREIRPTPDRVREALFSMLNSKRGPLTGCKVLDLFAGSGALGIEALSRGAAHAWFVDHSRQATGIISKNLERARLSDRATLMLADIWQALPGLGKTAPFAVIFADPPYGGGPVAQLLREVWRLGLLAGDGLLCLETAASDPVPERSGALQLFDRRRYGFTMIHFFHLVNEEPA